MDTWVVYFLSRKILGRHRGQAFSTRPPVYFCPATGDTESTERWALPACRGLALCAISIARSPPGFACNSLANTWHIKTPCDIPGVLLPSPPILPTASSLPFLPLPHSSLPSTLTYRRAAYRLHGLLCVVGGFKFSSLGKQEWGRWTGAGAHTEAVCSVCPP